MESIVIATTKSWNIARAKAFAKENATIYHVAIITDAKKLTPVRLKKLQPKYIFFPHWSWIIPKEIFEYYTCVVFHMTDLPFGRGGSPLQNLLSRGVYETKISALKVDGGLDTGPVYLKKSVSIRNGTAQEILMRISKIVFDQLIPKMLRSEIKPQEQKGRVTSFKRRKPTESDLNSANLSSLQQIYDFIRMLDGEGYPPAFVNLGNGLTMVLTNAWKDKQKITGQFTITKESNG